MVCKPVNNFELYQLLEWLHSNVVYTLIISIELGFVDPLIYILGWKKFSLAQGNISASKGLICTTF